MVEEYEKICSKIEIKEAHNHQIPSPAVLDDAGSIDQEDKVDLDFDFQSSQEMAKQLISGYAQLFASTYLAIESVSG